MIFMEGGWFASIQHFFNDLWRRKSSQLVFVSVDPMIFIGGGGGCVTST